jgi:cytochrome c oxidase subunit 4
MSANDNDSKDPEAGTVHTLPLVKAGPLHGPETAPPEKADPHADPHGHHGADFVPHILPLSVYILTWVTLIILTIVTVAASYFNFGAWNFVIAIVIATTKACVVAAIFMHLRWDRKFHTIIFSFSLIFLGIFIAFTMYDTETRGRTDIVEADRPVNVSTPFAGGKAERDLKERYEGQAVQGGSSAKAVEKIPVITPPPEATAPAK